jgi:hypothetical protein
MTKKKIRWGKIFANALVAFFSTLSGTITAQALFNLPVQPKDFLIVSFIVALIQLGLSFALGWSKAEEECATASNKSKSNTINVANLLSYMVFWD